MKSVIRICCVSLFLTTGPLNADELSGGGKQAEEQAFAISEVSNILDQFHLAASEADWANYFDLLTEDSIFLGTDVSERWSKAEFQSYAGDGSGWTYSLRERNINLTPSAQSAWFDEILWNDNYGTSRGTGVLVRTPQGWKISQYHLTFPIPNSLAAKMTSEIKTFEQTR